MLFPAFRFLGFFYLQKMNLNLANCIVFFDLETTGVNISKDRIVEISVKGRTKDDPCQSGNADSEGGFRGTRDL